MTPALAAYLQDVEVKHAEHMEACLYMQACCDIAIGKDVPTLVRLVRDAHAAIDKARRETASDPDNRWARNATIILNEALARAEGICKEGG